MSYNCPKCGKPLGTDNNYCPNCGQPINWTGIRRPPEQAKPPQPPESKEKNKALQVLFALISICVGLYFGLGIVFPVVGILVLYEPTIIADTACIMSLFSVPIIAIATYKAFVWLLNSI